MAGYNGYSMSNNAVHAYDNGEKPLSKWTKAALLAQCGDKAEMLSALTVGELRDLLLTRTAWHHTSEYFNRTDFFMVDEDIVTELTEDRVTAIIAARQPRHREAKPAAHNITAEIKYTVWEGRYRNYRRPVEYTETVTYSSDAKMVETEHGTKRLSGVEIIRIIEG